MSTDTAAFAALLNELRGPLTGVAAVRPIPIALARNLSPTSGISCRWRCTRLLGLMALSLAIYY